MPPKDRNKQLLDLVFLIDCTGSMVPYLEAGKAAIVEMSNKIASAGNLAKDDVRFGCIPYRDTGEEFVTQVFDLTSDVSALQSKIQGLTAVAGGDYPEAVTTALDKAINLKYRDGAHKVLVLIADGPPHGIGDVYQGTGPLYKDGLDTMPGGSPETSLNIWDIHEILEMLNFNWFVVKCEPEMSKYKRAVQFYEAKTRGIGSTISLGNASYLSNAVIGLALSNLDLSVVLEDLTAAIRAGKSVAPLGATSKLSTTVLDPAKVGTSLLAIAQPAKHVTDKDMRAIYSKAKSPAAAKEAIKSARKGDVTAELKYVLDYFAATDTKIRDAHSNMKPTFSADALENIDMFEGAKSTSDLDGRLKNAPNPAPPAGGEVIEVKEDLINETQVRRLATMYKQKYA